MKLPGRFKAYISQKKLTSYLLSETHIQGQLKAKFFRSVGFDKSNVEELKQELLIIAYERDVNRVITTPYGKKYILEGSIKSSRDLPVRIVTVWIVEKDEKRPRFVTTYPV